MYVASTVCDWYYDAGIIITCTMCVLSSRVYRPEDWPGRVAKNIKTIKRTCNQKCIDELNKTVKVKEEVNTEVIEENTQNSYTCKIKINNVYIPYHTMSHTSCLLQHCDTRNDI